MFATILRRWRLVTPLVLAVLAIAIVSGGLMMPASAHTIKFHFFGRAYAFNDNQPIPNTACDTGYLPPSGGSLDTGACFGAAGPGEPGVGVTSGAAGTSTFGRMYAIYADDSVVTIHGKVSGSVLATANLEGGIDVCLSQANCDAFFKKAGVNSTSRGCQNDVIGNQAELFCANDVEEQAYAFCHRHSDGSTQASVSATELQLNTPGFVEEGQFFLLGDDSGNGGTSFGLPNETFTVSGNQGSHLEILVTLNEQLPVVDGDLGAISATGIHVVVTNRVDLVKADFYVAHVFAGIHCAAHLGTDQNVGTLVGD